MTTLDLFRHGIALVLLFSPPFAFWAGQREERRTRRPLQNNGPIASFGGSPYRAPFSVPGQEPADPGEAWRAGVAAERARVLTIVRAVKEASGDSAVQRACAALAAGIDGGTVGK